MLQKHPKFLHSFFRNLSKKLKNIRKKLKKIYIDSKKSKNSFETKDAFIIYWTNILLINYFLIRKNICKIFNKDD